MRAPTLSVLMLTASLPLAGCATGRAGAFGDETITLRVVNRSGVQIGVAVSWAGGHPVHVGYVQNRREPTFSVSYTPAADLQVVVDFFDAVQATSNSIPVNPGETVELTVGVDRMPELRHRAPGTASVIGAPPHPEAGPGV